MLGPFLFCACQYAWRTDLLDTHQFAGCASICWARTNFFKFAHDIRMREKLVPFAHDIGISEKVYLGFCKFSSR